MSRVELQEQLYKHKRNGIGPHLFDILAAPTREARKEGLKQLYSAILRKDLDKPESIKYFIPSEYFDPNYILPLPKLLGLDWALRAQYDYHGRPYDHYKNIPCIENLAINIRTLERRSPPGTFPHEQWRSQQKTSALSDEMQFICGTRMFRRAELYVLQNGETGNYKHQVQKGATFRMSGYMDFSAVVDKVWGPPEESSNGTVAVVHLPKLQAMFEPGIAPALRVGDVVRVDVHGSSAGWLVLVTKLFEPDSVRGSFLCIGTGCRLWTEDDVRADLPGCVDADLHLAPNEVLLSAWNVSIQVTSGSRLHTACVSIKFQQHQHRRLSQSRRLSQT